MQYTKLELLQLKVQLLNISDYPFDTYWITTDSNGEIVLCDRLFGNPDNPFLKGFDNICEAISERLSDEKHSKRIAEFIESEELK